MFQIISTLEDLKAKIPELEAVYLKHASLSFYSPSYLITAAAQIVAAKNDGQLFVLTYTINKQIVNYIPLYIDAKKTLRFIFDVHTDYCACIGPTLSFNALKELAKIILDHHEIRKVALDNLLPNDILLNGFKHFLGLGAIISCYNNHSFVQNDAGNGLLTHLKSLERSKLKRIQKKNETCLFEVFDGVKSFPLLEIEGLKLEMIESKARSANFFDQNFIDFSTVLYDAGELEIFTKWDQTKLISASMVLKNGDFRMVWIDLYADVQFVNLSAYVDYIQYLERYPNVLFSFGRGSYDYKAKNFQPQLQNLYNLRYSKSKFSFLFSHYYGMKQFIKRLIKDR